MSKEPLQSRLIITYRDPERCSGDKRQQGTLTTMCWVVLRTPGRYTKRRRLECFHAPIAQSKIWAEVQTKKRWEVMRETNGCWLPKPVKPQRLQNKRQRDMKLVHQCQTNSCHVAKGLRRKPGQDVGRVIREHNTMRKANSGLYHSLLWQPGVHLERSDPFGKQALVVSSVEHHAYSR